MRLADVLLAIEQTYKKTMVALTAYRCFKESAVELLALYDLRADDLDQQSDECIQFIYSLLV
jgi:hypothetical protein